MVSAANTDEGMARLISARIAVATARGMRTTVVEDKKKADSGGKMVPLLTTGMKEPADRTISIWIKKVDSGGKKEDTIFVWYINAR
jgi:hypothetical protein